jgi:hypothetical protein
MEKQSEFNATRMYKNILKGLKLFKEIDEYHEKRSNERMIEQYIAEIEAKEKQEYEEWCDKQDARFEAKEEDDALRRYFEMSNVERAMEEIPSLYHPAKTYYKQRSSYAFKHELERFRRNGMHIYNGQDPYISNDEMIEAFTRLGFQSKPCDQAPMNRYLKLRPIHG